MDDIRKQSISNNSDTTSNATAPSFNSYNRTLFTSRYDEATRAKAKNDFRTKLVEAFDAAELPELGDNRKFGVDTKKVVLETILSVYEGAIALENRGSGMESLIKTEIALEKAGIIKENVPVVIGVNQDSVAQVLEKKAQEKNAEILKISKKD